MAKLPYMQFYPADYQADVRCLPMDAQGAWMQMLCILWRTPRGKRTLTMEEWAREIGCPSADLSLYLKVLEHHKVGKISREVVENVEHITINSKRILREKMKQKLALDRKRKQRDTQMSRACPTKVTPKNQISEVRSQNQISELREEKKEKKEIKTCAMPSAAATVWQRYSEAYQARYKTDPVRNAKVNGQLSQLIKRVGEHSAPEVAAFYVWHNDQFYVRARHPPGLLLRDCEGLHTQWKTGQTVTQSQARKIDETQGRVNVFQELIDERKGQVVDVKTA